MMNLKILKFWQSASLFFGLLQARGRNKVFHKIMNEIWWQALGIYYVGYNKLQREIERDFALINTESTRKDQ
jgi:hypothetical protein